MEQTLKEAFSAFTSWQARIDSWRHSGLSIARWCREHPANQLRELLPDRWAEASVESHKFSE